MPTVAPDPHNRPVGCNALRRNDSRLITARSEARRLPRGVDAPHLHRDSGEPRDAQHQHDHQRSDRESRFDRDAARLIA
ncbi:hypothetical protein A5724_06715 [Mycobacterium sp. ACS1612]|nr:hypothetical protein A5724_06715 [Mycobacterium sp. ACS1612]